MFSCGLLYNIAFTTTVRRRCDTSTSDSQGTLQKLIPDPSKVRYVPIVAATMGTCGAAGTTATASTYVPFGRSCHDDTCCLYCSCTHSSTRRYHSTSVLLRVYRTRSAIPFLINFSANQDRAQLLGVYTYLWFARLSTLLNSACRQTLDQGQQRNTRQTV